MRLHIYPFSCRSISKHLLLCKFQPYMFKNPDPSTLLSPCIYTAPTDIPVADGDPTVGRAVADPIGRLGRVALPPVCAVGDGPDVIPLSATLRSEEVFS